MGVISALRISCVHSFMCHPVGMLTRALMGIAIYISGLCCPPSSCLSSSMNCVIEFHRLGSPDCLPTYPISSIFTINCSLEIGLSKSSPPVWLCSLAFFAMSNSIVSFHRSTNIFPFSICICFVNGSHRKTESPIYNSKTHL